MLTNNDGRGLFTYDFANLKLEGERADILSADEFYVKHDSTRAKAKELLSVALIKLGLGPEEE